MLLALRNACLASLLFTGEWITNSVWVYKLETLWDEENSKEHQKRNFLFVSKRNIISKLRESVGESTGKINRT